MISVLVFSATCGFASIAYAARGTGLSSGTQWSLAAVGLCAVLSPVAFVASVLVVRDGPAVIRSSESSGRPDRRERLRIVTLNVLHGYPDFVGFEDRRARLAKALDALEPDVVLLQEVSDTRRWGNLADWLGRRSSMHVAYARANGSRRRIGFAEGCAILSRLPILTARRITLRPKAEPWETRIALWATLDTGDAAPIAIATAHLARGNSGVTAGQARDLARQASTLGVMFIGGDLNAPSGSAALRGLTDAGFTDLLSGGIDHALAAQRSAATWYVEQAAWVMRPEELEAWTGDRSPISDHPAILVELRRR
jgi:endonuclease/exonuclease/phosphatase family metal-dependent hydrolase